MIYKKTAHKFNSFAHHLFQSFIDRSSYDWIRLGVLLLVLLACIVFGYKVSLKLALLSVLLVGGSIGFILLLRRPEIGIVLLIPISFFIPWEVGLGSNTFNLTFLFAFAIIGIWIFRVLSTRAPIHLQTTSINILSILFLTATCISLLAGNIRWVIKAQGQASLPAQVGGWLLYVIPIGLMLYMQTNIKDMRWLKIIVWLFIFLGSIYIISLLLPFDFLSRFRLFIPTSVLSMYWTWLAALAFGQFLFNEELHPRYKIALGLLTIAIITTGLSTGQREWTSGWLPPLLAIGTILWLRYWRLGLAATLMAITILGISKFSYITNVLISADQYSITTRAATYPIMFELIKANPIIGLGFANYSHYTYLYPILGWYVSFSSHNNYVDIIAQTGFVGLILFLCLMIGIGLRGWKLHKSEVDGFCNGYINACLGGLVGMLASGMLGDWFLPYVYNIGIIGFRSSVFPWIFLGGLLAIGRIIDIRERENPTAEMSYLPP
jgi:O-antigen ligase